MEQAWKTSWVGRKEECIDTARPGPILKLANLLDHESLPWDAGCVPPLGHWLFFLPDARQSELGPDGHPILGTFPPPIDVAQRMWAGGRLKFFDPVPVGPELRRRSKIKAIVRKAGRSGQLVFVTLVHEIMRGSQVLLQEEQDLVYKPSPGVQERPFKPVPFDAGETVSRRELVVDTIQLFRYSALTYNSHRIHYDQAYASDVEGYPGLVVQGPYLATLLLDHFSRVHPDKSVREFMFRADSPLFAGETIQLRLSGTSGVFNLVAIGSNGNIGMSARVTV